MTRSLKLRPFAALAMTAAVSFGTTSCSSVERDAVRLPNGAHLSTAELERRVKDTPDAGAARQIITEFAQTQIAQQFAKDHGAEFTDAEVDAAKQGGATHAAALFQVLDDKLKGTAEFSPSDQSSIYPTALADAGIFCVRIFVGADEAATRAGRDKVVGGESMEAVATRDSLDPALKASGGVITDEQGNECIQLNQQIAAALAGVPAGGITDVISLAPAQNPEQLIWLFAQIRPYDEVAAAAAPFFPSKVRAALGEAARAAKVWVNPAFGAWSADDLAAVPLSDVVTPAAQQ